jgi:hypothetical protein
MEESMRITKKVNILIAAVVLLALPVAVFAESDANVKPYVRYELGAVKLLSHTYRLGDATNNSNFDFVNEGGQEILFPFERFVAGLNIADRHEVQFLYQPLELNTQVTFRETRTFDDSVVITAGTPVDLTYSFPFYRLTYRYKVLGDKASWLSAGGAVQLRNASIRITSLDGTASQRSVSQNLGVVPALSVAGRYSFGRSAFVEMEATGIYASSAFINGADFEFEGSLLDASLRAGMAVDERAEVFANLRFFGGGGAGVSQYPADAWTESVDRETDNLITALSLTLGATLNFMK